MAPRPLGHAGDRLSALLDDELDDEQALAVSRHVDACDPCLRELTELQRLRETLRDLETPAPSFSWMVETVLLPVERRRPRPRVLATLGATAVTLGVVLVAAWSLGGLEPGTVVPPVDMLVVDHVAHVEGGPVMTPIGLDGPVVTAGP